MAQVGTFFSSLSDSEFTADRDGKWTLAQNLDHLTRSTVAVAKALRLPKLLLRLLFGRGHQSRSPDEILAIYRQALDAGGEAKGQYAPQADLSRSEALNKWEYCGTLLLNNLNNWSEADLDRLRLPHPLIGKLTVREMLFFTLLHTQHHFRNICPE